MQRKLIVTSMIAAIGFSAAGVASAQSNGTNNAADVPQEQLFMAAKVTLDQATQIALKEVPGTLSAIGFNDENGVGVYEAMIVGADGKSSIVKINAETGAVLGKGLASLMDDEGDGGNDEGGNDEGGEGGEGGGSDEG